METIKNFFKRFGVWVSVGVGVCLMLLITYDIIITNILSSYYCSQEPNPKTLITKKVQFPISIYWEDNVYPGFSKEDRELMIINYLDGVHLKKMALNGDDGKIYVYYLEKKQRDIIKNKIINISNTLKYNKAYANEIMKTKQIFTKQTMPKLNYTVTFNEIKLNDFSSKFLYSDKTKVIDNKTDETIAYNRRFMRFFYNLVPDIALGNRYYWQKPVCGGNYFYFDRDVFKYFGKNGSAKHTVDLNKKLYKKYIKGEK